MPLITTIEELKLFNAPANLGIVEDTFLPCFAHVEETVLRPELGKLQYKELLESYNASIKTPPTGLSGRLKSLLAETRKVIAPLGILHYKNSILSQISDAGSVERSTEAAQPVRMWVNSLQTD